jgi:hypothetical protein
MGTNLPASAVERDVKLQTHREWAASLSQSEHVIVPEARHYLQNETPSVVIDAIKRVIFSFRNPREDIDSSKE